MRHCFLIALLFLTLIACEQKQQVSYSKKVENFRFSKDLQFKGANSPLTEMRKQSFTNLYYYQPDTNYIYTASVELLAHAVPVTLHLDTSVNQSYYNSVKIHFSKGDTVLSLLGYTTEKELFKHIFIPFKDGTTGLSTYSAGRFIDLNYDENKPLKIDFNYAYNPYCAYNEKYSCPVPPVENQLNVFIFAGEKYSLVENH